ncbi:MAG: ATP-binding protein, partial [Ignavibacteriales bacterium]|nr:ATP-binding protein [Ignavibacteriales bacterium]
VNLLRNAALHTQADSSITMSAYPEGKECLVTIEDNGPGFPPDSLNRIFEKFYRVPGSKTGGIGLGLSIAQGFVLAHGGRMTVENLSGGGARFTIRLPLESGMQSNVEVPHE